MKKMKRILAIMLCLTMAISGPLSVFAEETNTVVEEKCSECGSMEGHTEECSQYVSTEPEAECNCEAVDEKHAETCPKYTVPEDNQTTNEESEPVVESCTECGSTEGHTEECSHYIPAEPEIVSEENESVPEIGDKIWIKKGSKVYKNTTDDEKKAHTLIGNYKVEITEIVLNEDGSAAWYKFEFKNLGIGELWLAMSGYKYVQVENTSVEEPEEPTKPENPTEVELEDGTVVTVEGIPEDAWLSVNIPNEEKMQTVSLIKESLFDFDSSVAEDGVLSLTYDIKIMQGEDEWQPSNGESVDVTLDVSDFNLDYRTYLQGIHILDTTDAINEAVASGEAITLTEEGLSEEFPAETSAAISVGFPENTIVYTVMLPETGDMHIKNGNIVIDATSFSTVNITAFNVDNSAHSGEVEDVGLKVDKTATVKYETGEGYVELSSYVKGSVTNTPTDVVLVIDHSGSMWTAVDPSKQLEYSDLDDEKGVYEGYYVAFKKEKKEDNYGTPVDKTARLVRYKDRKWQWHDEKTSTVYDAKGNFVGFINTIWNKNTTRKNAWTDIDSDQADDYIFAVSISGALNDALNIFMEEMENAVDCRVAVCTFAGKVMDDGNGGKTAAQKASHEDLNSEKDFSGSGIFVDGVLTWDGTSQTLPREKNGGKNSYRDAFEDPSTDEGKKILFDTIEKINTDYGNTPTALGLLYARRLFNEGGRDGSNKVAVVFTDGIPSTSLKTRPSDSCNHSNQKYYWGNGETYQKEEDAKQAAEATVCDYCEPMKFQETVKKDGKDVTKNYYKRVSTYVDQANKLKTANHAVVYSIGPTAGRAGKDVLANIATDSDHYCNASGSDIAKVFRDIAGFIVSTSQNVTKDSRTIDVISECFMMRENTKEEDIEVYTADYTGTENGTDLFGKLEKFEEAEITLSKDEKKVQVWNFDYETQAVGMKGTDPVGQKLVVKIPIKTEPDFLGGDDVATNASAGIYNDAGTVLVQEFEKPKVDVKVKEIPPNVSDSEIYLSQAVVLPHIVNAGKFKIETTEYSINGINNRYVDIIYTIKDSDSNTFTYTIPAGTKYSELPEFGDGAYVVLEKDTKYDITYKIESVGDREKNKSIENDTAQICVYKPVITYKDSVLDLGDKAVYKQDNYVSIAWKHDNKEASISNMGNAPELQYTYDIEEGEFIKDQPVKVTTAISPVNSKLKLTVPKDMDLLEHVTFYREACDFSRCDHKAHANVTEEDPNFVVHLDKFNLKIKKTGADEDLDKFQTFIFEITKDNKFVMNVVIEGNGEVTVSSLPVGNYEVKEIIDWSWRYDVDDNKNPQKVELKDHTNGTVTVTFDNTRKNPNWMDGNSHAQNIFGDNRIISSGNIYQEGGN